jgi:tetratricopeptide (TPR) repeat protein
VFTPGKVDAMHSAFLRGLEIVDQRPNPLQELRLLGGLSIILTRACDFTGALELAKRGAAIARTTSDKAAIARADWDLGVCHHLCGHHSVVEKYCDSALNPVVHSSHIRKITDHGYDHRGRALIARARSLWLLGYPDRAIGAARFAISAAEEVGHPVSLCITLVYSSTVFIWTNEWAAAEAAIDKLLTTSQQHSLMYGTVGIALREISSLRRGAGNASVATLQRVLNDLRGERHTILLPMCQTTLSEALLEVERAEEARNIIDVAVQDLGRQNASVDGPEILRVKGAVMAALGSIEAAEAFIHRAIEIARQQSALSWELRAIMSLARLRAGRGEAEAAALVAPVFAKFTEGFETDDLRAAQVVVQTTR